MSTLDDIRLKRLQTLLGVWELLCGFYKDEIDQTQVALSEPLLRKVVEHYLNDLAVLKKRYNIDDKIQLHKIAGLMASAVMRYRPVIPLKNDLTGEKNLYANELLAIMHGIAICGEYTFGTEEASGKGHWDSWFEHWEKDFIYLLHNRNYTADSLIFIFETLVFWQFPKNITLNDA